MASGPTPREQAVQAAWTEYRQTRVYRDTLVTAEVRSPSIAIEEAFRLGFDVAWLVRGTLEGVDPL